MFTRSVSQPELYWPLLWLIVSLAVFLHFASEMISTELLLLLVVFALAAVAVLLRRKSPAKRFPPGPFPWPLVGNVAELKDLSRRLGGQHEALLELSRRHGSPVIALRLGGQDFVAVHGPECVHRVLAAEEFAGRPWNFFGQLRNMGKRKGITLTDGLEWQEARGWLVRSLRSVGFARRPMASLVADELHRLLERLNEQQPQVGVALKPLLVPAIINVLWRFVAGRRFDEARLGYFIGLMDRRARAFDMTGGLLSAYPWLRHIAPDYTGYNLLRTVNHEFRSVLQETIDQHKRDHVPGSEADLIDMYLNEMYSGKGPQAGFDDDRLVLILLDILLAGLNITATALDFLFLNMLINQDSQRLLHEEIDRVIGRDRLPDIDDRPKMPYVEAVILESHRLTPVVPVIGPRRLLRDSQLLDFHVPRDTLVLINLQSINSDPELYPEPRSFKPERFIKDGHLVRDDNLLFFGKGKRQCPGMSLAKTSLFILFTGIMQRYQILPVPGQQPPSLRVKAGMTMAPEPYEVFLVSRNNQQPTDQAQ